MGGLRATQILVLASLLWGCGDVELEGPQQGWPEPSCPQHLVLDPWDGSCQEPACQWDEDCSQGQLCDWIEGRCVRDPDVDPIGPWAPR